jgi:hypothetical protein
MTASEKAEDARRLSHSPQTDLRRRAVILQDGQSSVIVFKAIDGVAQRSGALT